MELLDMLNAVVEVPQWYLVAIAIGSTIVSMVGFLIVSGFTYKRALLRPGSVATQSREHKSSRAERKREEERQRRIAKAKKTLADLTQVDPADLSGDDGMEELEAESSAEEPTEATEEASEQVPSADPSTRPIMRRSVIQPRTAPKVATGTDPAKPAGVVHISRKK